MQYKKNNIRSLYINIIKLNKRVNENVNCIMERIFCYILPQNLLQILLFGDVLRAI